MTKMVDLINRDAVRRELNAQYAVARSTENPDAVEKVLREVSEFVDSLPVFNHWIPCNERLPEQGQRVIVQFRYGNNTGTVISTAQRIYSGSWIVDAMQYADKECITIQAWMPMPDRYEPSGTEVDTEKESD